MQDLFIPTRKDIERIAPGLSAVNTFGHEKVIVEVYAKKDNVHGQMFACFYCENGPNSKMSESYTEGHLYRGFYTSKHFTSAELDFLEEFMLRNEIYNLSIGNAQRLLG